MSGSSARSLGCIGSVHALLEEFLAELGEVRMVRTEIEEMLARYNARLDPKILNAIGGDRSPPIPLRLIAKPDSDG